MVLASTKSFWFFVAFYILGQTIIAQISFKNEMKRDLLNGVKSMNMSPKRGNSTYREATQSKSAIFDTDILEAYKKTHGGDVERFKPEYQISPNLFTFTGDTKITDAMPGATETSYEGGHFVQVPMGITYGLVFRFDLFGGGPKLLSQKTRDILRYVYGINVDDHGNPIPD